MRARLLRTLRDLRNHLRWFPFIIAASAFGNGPSTEKGASSTPPLGDNVSSIALISKDSSLPRFVYSVTLMGRSANDGDVYILVGADPPPANPAIQLKLYEVKGRKATVLDETSILGYGDEFGGPISSGTTSLPGGTKAFLIQSIWGTDITYAFAIKNDSLKNLLGFVIRACHDCEVLPGGFLMIGPHHMNDECTLLEYDPGAELYVKKFSYKAPKANEGSDYLSPRRCYESFAKMK